MGRGLKRSLRNARLRRVPGTPLYTLAFDKTIVVPDPGAAIAFASAVIGPLPAARLWIGGAAAHVTISNAGGVGLIAAFTGNFSIGSTPTADATLSGTDVDIVPSTVYTAAAGVTPRTSALPASSGGIMTNNATFLDNAAGLLELNFNLTVADASISAQATIRVQGELQMIMAELGK